MNPILPLWEYIPDGTIPTVEMTSLGFAVHLSPYEPVKAELAHPENEWMYNFLTGRTICGIEEFVFLK